MRVCRVVVHTPQYVNSAYTREGVQNNLLSKFSETTKRLFSVQGSKEYSEFADNKLLLGI